MKTKSRAAHRPIRSAALLMVGSELLAGRITDTNSRWLAGELAEAGVRVAEIDKVGDDIGVIAAALRRLGKTADLVITSGGLGPTFDDLTFTAIARAIKRPLRQHADARAWLLEWRRVLSKSGRSFMADTWRLQLRQARLPAGSVALRNLRGSAPGLWLENAGSVIVALPGVPREMEGLFREEVLPRVKARASGAFASAHYRFAPLAESEVEAAIGAMLKKLKNPEATVLARPGECSLILRAGAPSAKAAAALLKRTAAPLLKKLPAPFTADGRDIELLVAEHLAMTKETLALAESLTGGLIAARLTAIPGASNWLRGGAVVYTDAAKQELGVPAALLKRHGAVSTACARFLALTIQQRLGADFGLATTGFAGPGGGDERHPVGTYFVAVALPGGGIWIEKGLGIGFRETIRQRAATHALSLLLRHLRT